MAGTILQIDFFFTIQIWRKFWFVVIQILMKWLQQNFAQGTTGMCKLLLQPDDQELNYSKIIFASNLNCERKVIKWKGSWINSCQYSEHILQCGAVIMQSIFSQIFTKDTP